MYALNIENGTLEWSFIPGYFLEFDTINNYITTPILSDPYVKDNVVYFGAKGNVYALDAQTFEKPEETPGGASEFNYEILLIIISLVVIAMIILAIFYFYKKGKMGGKE